jgi:CBS domain-containing protein
MLVQDVMTRQVVTVNPETPIATAVALATGRGFTALPVVDAAGELVGLVTEADLLRDHARNDPTGGRPTRVDQVMTTQVLTVAPATDLSEVVRRMQRLGIRSMPVVRASAGLVGIVSRRDVLAATGEHERP